MDYSTRIDFIKKNIIIQFSQFGFGSRCQYAICNRIQGTYPYNANIELNELQKLKNGDKIYINLLIPNVIEALDTLCDFLQQTNSLRTMEATDGIVRINDAKPWLASGEPLGASRRDESFEENTPLQLYFLLMAEPIIPEWIIQKLYPFTIRMYLQNNSYHDPKIGFMPIGIRDGEEVHKEHQYFSGQLLLDELNQSREKEFLCLLCFSHTHPERKNCENVLGNNPDYILNVNKAGYIGQPSRYCGKVPIRINYEYTHKSFYVLSPSGVGEATHRFFEAIALHAIPIVKKTNTPFDSLYDFFPCFVIDNWEDITKDVLEKNLKNLTQKLEDFHKMYPDFLTYPYDFFI